MREGDFAGGERGGFHDVLVTAGNLANIFLAGKFVSLERAAFGIDNPIMRNAGAGVKVHLLGLVGGGAGGREDFDAEVGSDRNAVAFDEMHTRLGDEEDVRTADVEIAKDRIDIADESPQVVLIDVGVENAA